MRYIISSIVCFILCYELSAQSSPKTLLWEITKANSKHKSYLFGTNHEIGSSFFDSLSVVMDKLKGSDLVFVEEAGSKTPDSLKRVEKLYTWHKGIWDTVLSEKEKNIFKQFVDKSEMNTVFRLAPFSLARWLSTLYFQNYCDFSEKDNGFMLDKHIENKAIQYHKTVQSLDEYQSALLNKIDSNISIVNNDKFGHIARCIELMQLMLNEDTSGCTIINNYKKFNIDYKLEEGISDAPIMQVLLKDRNESWVKKFEPFLEKHYCFIAVGLQHLFYKEGLIQLLRRKGYQVLPVAILR